MTKQDKKVTFHFMGTLKSTTFRYNVCDPSFNLLVHYVLTDQ